MPGLQEEPGLSTSLSCAPQWAGCLLGKGNLPIQQDKGALRAPGRQPHGPSTATIQQPPPALPQQEGKPTQNVAVGVLKGQDILGEVQCWMAKGSNSGGGRCSLLSVPWHTAWHRSDFHKALVPLCFVSSPYRDWQQ